MSKRFSDSGLYSKAWFRKLPPKIKCLWEWIRCNCDHAGVFEFDPELASFQIGEEVNFDSLNLFENRIERVEKDKFWLVDFISFQYGTLKENYNPHKPVIASLKKHGLFSRVVQGLPKGSLTLVDKDKDKDKGKDKDKDKPSLEISQLIETYNKYATKTKKHNSFFLAPKAMDELEISTGFPGLQTTSDWAKVFELAFASEFLRESEFCNLLWLLKADNAQKVLENSYGSVVEKIESDYTEEDLAWN